MILAKVNAPFAVSLQSDRSSTRKVCAFDLRTGERIRRPDSPKLLRAKLRSRIDLLLDNP